MKGSEALPTASPLNRDQVPEHGPQEHGPRAALHVASQGRPQQCHVLGAGRCLAVTSCLTPGCTGPWHTLWRWAFLETRCPGGSPSRAAVLGSQ